jgi:uncharacterized Zn finger protein (UPF0148 family)
VSKRPTCPVCKSINLKTWSMGKVLCKNCGRAFPKHQIASEEYVPKKPRKSRSTRKQADKQEQRVAKQVGGRQTIASGQTPVDKADVRSETVRVECKYTDKKSYSLKAADLAKVASQATGDQMPLFYVEFREHGEAYYVVPEHWFLQLLELYENDSNDC